MEVQVGAIGRGGGGRREKRTHGYALGAAMGAGGEPREDSDHRLLGPGSKLSRS
jgi:hypothetical protein